MSSSRFRELLTVPASVPHKQVLYAQRRRVPKSMRTSTCDDVDTEREDSAYGAQRKPSARKLRHRYVTRNTGRRNRHSQPSQQTLIPCATNACLHKCSVHKGSWDLGGHQRGPLCHTRMPAPTSQSTGVALICFWMPPRSPISSPLHACMRTQSSDAVKPLSGYRYPSRAPMLTCSQPTTHTVCRP